MIREEAIAYLVQADATVYKKIKTKTAEALEMAIKALEQEEAREHMDMLIAHKDKALETHPYFKQCGSCIHSEEQDGSNCYECIKDMADNFEAQPTSDDDIIKALKAVRTIHNGNYAPQIDEAIRRLEVQPTGMRDATEEERKSVKDYIESISKPTGFNFYKAQPCEDAVSRADVKEGMQKYGFHSPDMTVTEFVEDCLPSVKPQTVTEFVDKCKECGKIKEDLYEKGFEDGKRYIVEQMCALLEKEVQE